MYSRTTMPDLGYSRWVLNDNIRRAAGDGSIGVPPLYAETRGAHRMYQMSSPP
jgi:hypothetical protein